MDVKSLNTLKKAELYKKCQEAGLGPTCEGTEGGPGLTKSELIEHLLYKPRITDCSGGGKSKIVHITPRTTQDKVFARYVKTLMTKGAWDTNCKYNVDMSFSKANFLPRTDGILIAGCFHEDETKITDKNSTIAGFLLYSFSAHPGTMYIDVVCSAGGKGWELIDKAKEIAQAHKKTHITLSALPDVIMYYRSLGFINAEDHDCEEEPEVAAAIKSLPSHVPPRDVPKTLAFKELLKLLTRKSLVGEKNCLAAKTVDGKENTFEKKVECNNNNGYLMTFCFRKGNATHEKKEEKQPAPSPKRKRKPSKSKQATFTQGTKLRRSTRVKREIDRLRY